MRILLSILFAVFSSAALAHTGVGDASGFAHGFVHPIGGLDHILAMVAVGMFAANLGGRAIWAVPLTFMGVMAAGGALGVAGISLPFVEVGIALSIVVLGLAVATRLQWPVAGAMALVGLFAVFHGHTHGTEMPLDASGVSYAAGFLAATGLLHLAGIGLGFGLARGTQTLGEGRLATQLGGGLIAVAGLGVLTGVI